MQPGNPGKLAFGQAGNRASRPGGATSAAQPGQEGAAFEAGNTAADDATCIANTFDKVMRGVKRQGRRDNLGHGQIEGDSLWSTQVGKFARNVSDLTVKASPAQQLRVLLADTLASLTRGNSRQDLRVRNPCLADLRVARGRRRGTGLSHVGLTALMAKEP